MTPSSSKACHIPAAWALVCILLDNCSNQSTSSVPGAHLRTRRPDTFLSRRQLLVLSRRVRSAHPMRPMDWLGASVIVSAGLGWSGLFERREGGEPEPWRGEDLELTPGPKPKKNHRPVLPESKENIKKQLILVLCLILILIRWFYARQMIRCR